MSTASKATAPKPGPAGAKAVEVKPPKVTIDYSSLVATPAEALPSTSKSLLSSTPFVAWLTESWDKRVVDTRPQIEGSFKERGEVRTFTIPAAGQAQTEKLLRDAAEVVGCGVAIRATEPDEAGNVTLGFRAQSRRVENGRKPRNSGK